MDLFPRDDPYFAVQDDIHEGVRQPVVGVFPEPNIQFLHNGREDSLVGYLANGMADDSDFSSGRALRLDEVDVASLNGKYNIFLLDDTDDKGNEAFRELCLGIERQTPFDDPTYFAFLTLKEGSVAASARLLRQRFVDLGGVEITPLRVLADSDHATRIEAIRQWRFHELQQGFATILHGLTVPRQLFIARRTNPNAAYAIVDGNAFAPIPLGGGRGHVYKGTMYRRNGNLFMEPSQESAIHVAIKKLDVLVVLNQLRQGSNEHPLRELLWLQILLNTGFVPELFEALFDGRYLYIITRWADGGNLADEARRHPGARLPIGDARNYARQIFHILEVLHEVYEIAHSDLKPANLLLHDGRILVTDFAQSMLIPLGGRIRAATTLADLRGTFAFMVPELYNGQVYDARQADLWGVGATLFTLVTGTTRMYSLPTVQDFLFEYLVMARSVSRIHPNPEAQAIQNRLHDEITLINGYLEIAVIDGVLDQSARNEARTASLTNYLAVLRQKRRYDQLAALTAVMELSHGAHMPTLFHVTTQCFAGHHSANQIASR
jgi:serine/threonine protein kinase